MLRLHGPRSPAIACFLIVPYPSSVLAFRLGLGLQLSFHQCTIAAVQEVLVLRIGVSADKRESPHRLLASTDLSLCRTVLRGTQPNMLFEKLSCGK